MGTAHESIFSYSISRPYPFKWFTPVVLVVLVAATALFSFLNFASNGYDLIVKTALDPNATVSDNNWFQKWPSYLTSKIQPSCQDVDIHVNTQLFTNQTALTYTLTDVWQTSADGGNRTILPSLTYHNNPIEQCAVSSIEVDLESLNRGANQIAYTEWGPSVRAYVTCSIEGANGRTSFNLTTTYDYVPATVTFSGLAQFLGSNFLNRDPEKRASLYWGESLMSAWWEYLEQEMQTIRENATSFGVPAISKGTVSMTPNNQSTSDITDLSFFEVDFRFIINAHTGDNTFDVIHPGLYNYSNSIGYLNAIKAAPNVWVLADSLAKSTHSTILTDLGQTSFTPNILADPDTLQHFTSNFSVDSFRSNMKPGPAVRDYDTLKNTTGTLGVTPSVFSTNYLCQIPQLKSAGNLFAAVLLADLVFLQALWKIFTLLVGWLGLQNRPGADECQGCIDQARRKRGTRWEAGVLSPEGPTTEQVELNVLDGAKARMHHRRASSQHQPLLR